MKTKLNTRIVAVALAVSVLSISHFALAVNNDGGGGGGGGLPPTATLSASPTSTTSGAAVTLTWSSTRAVYGCSGDIFTVSGTSGSTTVNPTVTTTYTITCDGTYGSAAASATVTVSQPVASDLTASGVTPTSATVSTPVTLSATISNIGTASTGASFVNLFQRATDSAGTGATDIGTYTATTLASSGSVTATSSYTFPSAATWYVRACADKNSAASAGTITESNEANNCGAWTAVTVTAVTAPTATLSGSPTSITSGSSSIVTWSSTSATSCTGTGFTASGTSGSVSVTPTVTTTYSVSCSGAGGTATASVTITVQSGPNTTHYNDKLCSGGTNVGTYTDSVNSCLSFCTGLSASCCSTTETFNDSSGTDTFVCKAYTNSTTTVTTNSTTQCVVQSGEPVCTYKWYSADLINYGPVVGASLVTNPTSMSAGQTAVVTWSSTNATSCTGTNFSTGGATSGSVTVSPSTSTMYTVSCSGAGGTATDSKTITVNVFTVSCSPSSNPTTINTPVSWTSTATGGTGTYTYSWTGDDGLTGTGSSVSKTYTSLGEKVATLQVTSGSSSIKTTCIGSPCQLASCACVGAGCGVVVSEGTNTDISAAQPSLATGTLVPGGTVTFAGDILDIGNNSINALFSNRFQLDTYADGTYDTNLDVTGNTGTGFVLQTGKICSGGTLVTTDSATVSGGANLASTITQMCQADSVSGQCCSATVTATAGGGGGGGFNNNLAGGINTAYQKLLASPYTSLAVATNDIAVSVYSSPSTLITCPGGQTCYGGTWSGSAGIPYVIPYGTTKSVTSPAWSNIPIGTHKIRLCADSPTSGLAESNEGNNCGPDYTFTVAGSDFTAGLPGVNSGTLIAGQPVTFFGNIINNTSNCATTGQCQATVTIGTTASTNTVSKTFDCQSWGYAYTECPMLVSVASVQSIVVNTIYSYCSHQCPNDSTPNPGVNYGIKNGNIFWVDHGFRANFTVNYIPNGPACSISLTNTGVTWGTTNASIVNVTPVTSSPTVPATGGGNVIKTGYDNYYTSAVAADMQAHGGVTLSLSNGGFYSGTNEAPNRLCQILDGASSVASSYTQTSWSSCGNNILYKWEVDHWTQYGGCAGNNKLRYTLYCSHPDSPYTLNGTYTFPAQLPVGTHTYRVSASNGAGTTNTCDATITVPAAPGPSCNLTATPQNIASGNASILSWIMNNATTLTIDHGVGTVTTNSGQSCLPAGSNVPAGHLCSQAGLTSIPWGECCSGTARIQCPAPNEPAEAYCYGDGAGQTNTTTVTPTVTTTYTGTVTGSSNACDFTGSMGNRFQIDLGNDGTWDTILDAPGSVTNLSNGQTKSAVSPTWVAVLGTHAIRLCANTPSGAAESNPNNNCGPSFVFTVANAGQCGDGIDNNNNGLIDGADPACHSDGNPANAASLVSTQNEVVYPAATMTLVASKATVKKSATVTLTWSATSVQTGSCKITSDAGDSWTYAGLSGVQTTNPITQETVYTLSCKDLQSNTVTTKKATVKLAPIYEET